MSADSLTTGQGALRSNGQLVNSDENGRKNSISTFVSIFFLAKTGSGSENAGLETES
jgi:hypothetical protein